MKLQQTVQNICSVIHIQQSYCPLIFIYSTLTHSKNTITACKVFTDTWGAEYVLSLWSCITGYNYTGYNNT